MLSPSKPMARQPRKWSSAEDQKLREEVEAQRNEGEVKDWCRIADKLPGRTNKDCRKRWLNSVAGGLKKGQWAKNEDLQLARGVEQFGQRWTLVAEVVGSRSADQCAKRWQQSLDPELDRSEWRESEDQILIEAVQKLGRHWKDIQRHHFPGRSKNCIKNRYTVIVRRFQNSGIPLPEGVGTSAPSTPRNNRLSTYSTPDEDAATYSDNLYNDILHTPQTQVSTPEIRHSWSLDDEPFPSWSSSDSFAMNAIAAPVDYTKYPQAHPAHGHVSSSAQWGNWTTTAMDPAPLMNLAPSSAYQQPSYTTQAPSYSTYTAMPAMIAQRTPPSAQGHGSSFYRAAPPPTSSPRLMNSTGAVYQDQQDRYLKYGGVSGSMYRF